MSGAKGRTREQQRRMPIGRLRVLLLCAGLLVLTACSALQAPSTGDVHPVTGEEPVEPATGAGSPPAIPEWIREPFHEAFAGQGDVDALLDRQLNVLRLAHDPEEPPAFLAWLTLDRLNGLGLLYEPRAADPGRPDVPPYVVTYRVDRPIAGVSFDQHTRFLILTVIEESGSGLWGHWFRVLQPVASGGFREVWRGPAYVSMAKGSDYAIQRQAGLITDPRNPEVLLHSHVTQLLHQPPGGSPQVVRRDERVDAYEWDDREQRFVPTGPVPGAGRYLALESAFTVPFAAVNVFIAGAARPHLSPEAALRLVDSDGQVVAVSTRVDAGTHMWLQIPTGLAPGTYRVELAPAPDRAAADAAGLEVVDVQR